MTESSSRMEFPFPSRDDDPWYDGFDDFVRAVDASGFAHREDRSIVWAGGGTVDWVASTGTFTWTATINVYSPIGSRLIQIAADNIAGWVEGEVVYVTLTRQPLENLTATFVKASQLPSNNNAMAFGVRIGGTVFFRTGISLNDGNACIGVSPVPASGGSASISENFAGDYSYTQLAFPVEETMGYGVFDASLIGTFATYFRATWNPQFGVPGSAEVRLYDIGAADPPVLGAPVLISTLTRNASGIWYSEDALITGASPAAGQLATSLRMYEVAVYQSSQAVDTVYIGSAGLTLK